MERSLSTESSTSEQSSQAQPPRPQKHIGFVWEDTPGLDHHCPVCAVPESHTGTLLSICLGDHVMPCCKYHQNLFWPNKTLECEACRRSREEHFKRHKTIAAAVRALEKLNNSTSEDHGEGPQQNPFCLDGDDDDDDTTAGCPTDSEPPQPRQPGTPQRKRKHNKAAKKLEKALSRTAVDAVTGHEVQRVAAALHPHAPRDDGDERDRIDLDDPGFPAALAWDARGCAWHRRQLGPGGVVEVPDFERQADAALARLGVDVGAAAPGREARALVAQLRLLARADFENVWNEEAETAKRRGGFLRFVNRGTLDRMINLRRQRVAHATRAARAEEEKVEDEQSRVVDAVEEAEETVQAPEEEVRPRVVRIVPINAGAKRNQKEMLSAFALSGEARERTRLRNNRANILQALRGERGGADRNRFSVLDSMCEDSLDDDEEDTSDADKDDSASPINSRISSPASSKGHGDEMSTSKELEDEGGDTAFSEMHNEVRQTARPPKDPKPKEVVLEPPSPHVYPVPIEVSKPPVPELTPEEKSKAAKQQAKEVFSNSLQNLFVSPFLKPVTSTDFFSSGLQNIHNHNIWAPVSDIPLQPKPDPEEEYVEIDSIHAVDPSHPRWDDWKSFEQHLHRILPHPWTTTPSTPFNDATAAAGPNCPPKLSKARIIVPMGDAVHVTAVRPVEEVAVSLAEGAPGCPAGQLGMLAHAHIATCLIDASAQPPAYLTDQFARREGHLAEQCWQFFLIGRRNAQNLALRDGLARKLDANGGLTRLEAAALARLRADATTLPVTRVCVCGGLPTERMLECAHARCPIRHFHARCLDATHAPPPGERFYCRACRCDMTWFLEERALLDTAASALARAATEPAALAPLVRLVLREIHARVPPGAWRTCPVEELAAEVDGVVQERRRAGGEVPPARDIADGILGWRCVQQVEGEGDSAEVCERCEGVKEGEKETAGGAKRQKGRSVKAEDVEVKLPWGTMELGAGARKVYREDPVRSAEAVLRLEMRLEMERNLRK
ncbi:Sulphatase-modifying factor [Neofusicoccum parvum]|nr:Sulphatase-modifying factor [Neofusicoccum parvum]